MVGNGCKIRYWEDPWCGESPLSLAFPTLYELTGSKGAKVVELRAGFGEEGCWNFRFSRPFND